MFFLAKQNYNIYNKKTISYSNNIRNIEDI